jgi:ureidoglycolate lyase
MIELRPKPLTKTAFAPFGDVVEVDGANRLEINQGYAQRYNGFANIDVTDEGGQAGTCIIVAQPRPTPIAITLMERHPLGSQLFIPMQQRPWIVLVCTDPNDATTFQAFQATGQQGVNYRKGTWHHPLLVTEKDTMFFEVSRMGAGNNLEEVKLQNQMQLSIAATDDDPFSTFTEWNTVADDEAFNNL